MQPSPDWRLCHPVNIYIFKNGINNEQPILVHIPADKKRNMEAVLEAVQVRIKFPTGYPTALYRMDGSRICESYELEMYESYVVVSNKDRRFRCVLYGMQRSPLVVVGPSSKNVRNVRLQNPDVDKLIERRKQGHDSRKYAFAYDYTIDGFGPTDLPYVSNTSKPCGVLCRKLKVTPESPTPSCSEDYDSDTNSSSLTDPRCCFSGEIEESRGEFLVNYLRESFDMKSETSQNRSPEKSRILPVTTSTIVPVATSKIVPVTTSTKLPVTMVDRASDAEPIVEKRKNSSIDSDHLIEFVKRYRDIGGELNRLFNEKMSQNNVGETSKLSTRQLSQKPSRDSRVADDLHRMFSDRIEQEGSGSDVTGVSSIGSTERSSTPTPFLPSLGDLKDIDDKNTGNDNPRNPSASTGNPANHLSKYEPSLDRRKSLSSLLNESTISDTKTGTTVSSSRKAKDK